MSVGRRWLRWGLGTIAVAIAAAWATGAWVAVHYEARLGQMARELAALRQRLSRDEVKLSESGVATRDLIDRLRDPATRIVPLSGVGPGARATGRIVWHPAQGGLLVVAGLPPAPANHVYQVWMLGAGELRAAGRIEVDAGSKGLAWVAVPGVVATGVPTIVVTLEAEGLVGGPAGPRVLVTESSSTESRE